MLVSELTVCHCPPVPCDGSNFKKRWNDAGMSMKTKNRRGKLEGEAGMCMKTSDLALWNGNVVEKKVVSTWHVGRARDCGGPLWCERQEFSAGLARRMQIVPMLRSGSESKCPEWTLNWVTIGHNFALP
jgi:hypothetical protein